MTVNAEHIESIILEADKFSGGSMKEAADTQLFALAIFTEGGQEAFEKLVFDAKYAVGLFRAMQRSAEISGNTQVVASQVQQMADDFTKTMSSLRERLEGCLTAMDETDAAPLREKYLALHGDALQQFMALLGDFDIVKKYLNAQKRN